MERVSAGTNPPLKPLPFFDTPRAEASYTPGCPAGRDFFDRMDHVR
jgi:hypothetical protein